MHLRTRNEKNDAFFQLIFKLIIIFVVFRAMDEDTSRRFYYKNLSHHGKNKAVTVVLKGSSAVIGGHCAVSFYNYPSDIFAKQFLTADEYIRLVTDISGPILTEVSRHTRAECIPEMVSFYERDHTDEDVERINRVIAAFVLAKGIVDDVVEVRTETGRDVRVRDIRERDITEYERDKYKCMAVQVVYRQKTLSVSYVFYP